MALGTITKPTPNPDFVSGNKKVRVRRIQLTSGANYVTGGATITPRQVGLSLTIDQANVLGEAQNAAGTGGVTVGFNTATGKLQAYFSATTAADTEAGSNADLSTYSVLIQFIGT